MIWNGWQIGGDVRDASKSSMGSIIQAKALWIRIVAHLQDGLREPCLLVLTPCGRGPIVLCYQSVILERKLSDLWDWVEKGIAAPALYFLRLLALGEASCHAGSKLKQSYRRFMGGRAETSCQQPASLSVQMQKLRHRRWHTCPSLHHEELQDPGLGSQGLCP